MNRRLPIAVLLLVVMALVIIGIQKQDEPIQKQPPEPIPEGVLISEIPASRDIIFTSIRYVLRDIDCLNEDYELKDNFIADADCNKKIYDPEVGLASPRQLFLFDLETREATQITNLDCFFINGQVVNSSTLMVNAACSDTNDNGKIDEGARRVGLHGRPDGNIRGTRSQLRGLGVGVFVVAAFLIMKYTAKREEYGGVDL